jgi:PAS domain S-box-containing protein
MEAGPQQFYLDEKEHYYRDITDSTPVMIWRTGPDVNCTYLNKTWHDFTGQTPEEALEFGWLDVIHPEDAPFIIEALKNAHITRSPLNNEYRLKHHNGHYKWHLDLGQPKFDQRGNFQGFVGTIVDIHERKEAENALRKSEQYFKTYAEAMPQMAFIADASGNVVYFNKRWYDYIGGLEGTEGWGWKEKQVLHPQDLQECIDKWTLSLETGRPYEIEYRLRRHDGQYRWHLGKALPIRDTDGKIDFWLGTNTDIHAQKLTEEALRASEKRLRIATSAMELGIFEWDLKVGQTVWDNHYMYSIFGVSDGKPIKIDDFYEKVIHPDDLEIAKEKLGQAIEMGHVLQIEVRIHRVSDQQLRWIEVFGKFDFDDHGNPVCLIGVLKDITERKKLEEQLKNEQELLQTIYDTIPIMLAIYDPSIQVTRLNKAVEKITGWTEEDWQYRDPMELAYPNLEYRQMVLDYMSSLTPGFKDLVMTTKSGKQIETSWANVKISDGRNVGIGIDISHRKVYERQLSEMSQKLQTVVENIADGVIMYNPEGEIIGMNKAAKDIISYLADYPAKYDPKEIVLWDKNGIPIPEHDWPRNRVQRGESFIKEEYWTINKVKKKEVYLEYTGIPIMEDNRLIMAIITVQDITERKKSFLKIQEANHILRSKNKQLKKINQLHENLLYIIAHDLRNPIGNMFLIIDLLKRMTEGADKEELMEKLQEMVVRQENIINGLVELLQVQSPEKMNPQNIELEALVKDVINENEAVLSECGAVVNLNFQSSPVLKHIPSFVTSIVKNLVNNAIKYRKNYDKLVLNITSADKDEFLLLTISDNGIGIDISKHKANLFQPFKRFTKQSQGTGMGLYLIKNLIEKNGGYIDVESEPGVGTSFHCYFKKY